MAKKGKKGKKGKGEEVVVEEIPEDLQRLTPEQLQERIEAYRYRFHKAAKDRNYMQLEKDMVNRFYDITKQEVRQIEAELLNMDMKMEMDERDHRVLIKVHEQKVQNLEYEHKEARRQVEAGGEDSIQQERETHKDHVLSMNKEKLELKSDLRDQQRKKR